MPNPFSSKAGKGKKTNPFSAVVKKPDEPKRSPFSVKAGVNGSTAAKQEDPRNRMTGKDRSKALRAAEKAKGGDKRIANPSNPWVHTAYDVTGKVTELSGQIENYQKQYTQQLKIQKKAKTPEEITSAFNRGDALMTAIIGLCAQRRRLIGGASV